MADEIDIEPEFEDDDSFESRLNKASEQRAAPTSGEQIDNDYVIPQGMGYFGAKKGKSNTAKEIRQAQREANRRRKEAQAEARRAEAERRQDATRERSQATRDAKNAATQATTDIRSDATAARIQTYSLGSAVGLQGYVFSNLVDNLLIRPKEEAAAGEQEKYKQDLEAYNRGVQQDQVDRKRREQEAIRNMPVDATALDENGKPMKLPPLSSSKVSIPEVPPRIKPTAPNSQGLGAGVGSIGAAASVATGVILAAQKANQAIDNISTQASATGSAVVRRDAMGSLKGMATGLQNTVDPIGALVPLNVAVDGFTTLLDINQGILDSIGQTIAFSPETLNAQIEGELSLLNKQIENARKLDPVTSELMKANNQLNLAIEDLRVSLIESLGPEIADILRTVSFLLENSSGTLESIIAIARTLSPKLDFLLDIAAVIAEVQRNKEAKELDDADILGDLNQFFNNSVADIQI